MMSYFLYDAALTLALPAGAAWVAAHPRHRPLLHRFSPAIPPLSAPPLWVHACSVGEVGVAKPLLAALAKRWPEYPALLTVSTRTGQAFAAEACPNTPRAWFPFDHRWCVNRFLHGAQPRALLLIETEIWPNVLRLTAARGIPSLIVNGRLSDKHFHRYLRWRSLVHPVLQNLAAAAMQNAEYAERLATLGLPRDRIHVTGNTKFDGVRTAFPPEELREFSVANGFAPDQPLLVFGSTRPGDEALAAQCWAQLKPRFPDLKLLIAPRHLQRIEEALAPFHEPILRRSEILRGRKLAGERVFFLDTVGELVKAYALGTVAVVGGSFLPDVQGHNPLEPAALGTPTVFGPYMRNFIDPAQALVANQGARQVSTPEDLRSVLEGLLANATERAEMARRGREAILANQGAIERTLDLLASLLPPCAASH